MLTQDPRKFAYNYRPSRWEQLRQWAMGIRCDISTCHNRAVGRYVLAQEFGTITGDLCQSCLDSHLKAILEAEWAIYEREARHQFVRGGEVHISETWCVKLAGYKANWVGRALLWCGVDR